jgi:GABA permease
VKNPLRDEASAFQVVLITLAGAVLVVVAAWLNTWLGLAVFIVLLGAALWAIRGGLMQRPPQAHVVRDDGPARRILVIANETVGGEELFSLLGLKAKGVDEEMLLVCPALNSRVRTWTSDEDPARADAQERLDASLSRLAAAGVSARGEIGDGDPLQALEDALREFPADEIVVSTHPPGRSHWLEQGVVEQARLRYDVPVTHVVVDLGVVTESAREA